MTLVDDKEDIFELDDMILLSIIGIRYLVQIVRLGYMIRNSRQTVAMTVEMKQVDFNAERGGQGSENTHNESAQRSEIMRKCVNRLKNDGKQEDMHVELNEEV